MFVGSDTYSVDAKGRISIPTTYKKLLSTECKETFMLVRGLVSNIDVYPIDLWNSVVRPRIEQLDDYDVEQAAFKRMFLELAGVCELDGQSRLLVPRKLLDFAKIDKEVFILGQTAKIELWNPAIYKAQQGELSKSFAELAKQYLKPIPK
jgi:MraZ protein